MVVLGSHWFRATGVDPASLTLGDENGLDTPIARSKSKPVSKLTDLNRDGFTDLVAEFTKRDLVANGDLAVGTRTLILLGRTRDGGHVRGADVAQVGP